MENFANTTPPPKKVIGQLWYDTTGSEKKLKFWDGATWKSASGVSVAPSSLAPSNLTVGEFWWDTTAKQLKVWTGDSFLLIGPENGAGQGVSDVSFETVGDKLLITIKDNGKTVAVFSSYDEVISVPTTHPLGLEGFTQVFRGITLPPAGSGTYAYKFNGTATNSDKLDGVPASEYIRTDTTIFNNTLDFKAGFKVGGLGKFSITYDNDNSKIVIKNNDPDESIYFNINSNDIFRISKDGVIPATNNAYTLGTSADRWSAIYGTSIVADAFSGNLTGNVTGTVTGNIKRPGATGAIIVDHVNNIIGAFDKSTTIRGTFDGTFSGSLAGVADSANTLLGYSPSKYYDESTGNFLLENNTVVVRSTGGDIYARNIIALGSANRADTLAFDSSFYAASSIIPAGTDKRSIVARDTAGDVEARLFKGTATAARYADLAEKYLADKDYEVGTVVSVGGEAEVTASNWGDRPIGVVSSNPAFMMNMDLEGGIYIALKGRVPVKVIGSIRKGQRLIASKDGVAVAAVPHSNDVFAIALESSDDTGVKLIESVIL